eukprot:5601004-Lingulodinium_polyedra.AAC.1
MYSYVFRKSYLESTLVDMFILMRITIIQKLYSFFLAREVLVLSSKLRILTAAATMQLQPCLSEPRAANTNTKPANTTCGRNDLVNKWSMDGQ